VTLNDVLGDETLTYAWFDERLARGATPIVGFSGIRRRLLQRGRPGDLVAIMDSPLDLARVYCNFLRKRDRAAADPIMAKADEWIRSEHRLELALILSAMEAVRPDDAAPIRALILETDSSSEMNRLLGLSFTELCQLELSGH
jgi:hypothetical protein